MNSSNTAPPSAPVGVDEVIVDMERWVRAAEASGPNAAARTVIVQEWSKKLRALAQQPSAAPVGVEAALRAEFVPLSDRLGATLGKMEERLAQQPAAVTQPGAGEASNGSGQPAAVNGAMVERFSRRWYEITGRSLDRPYVLTCLEAALAAQQGGA